MAEGTVIKKIKIGTTEHPIIDTDTKNTTGATNSTEKLFLIGATDQSDVIETNSNDNCYISDGYLYSKDKKVINEIVTASGTNIDKVGTPSVTVSNGSDGKTTLTFNYLKGTAGTNGTNGSDGSDGSDGYNILYSTANGTSSTISLAKANISNNSSLKIGDLVLCKSGCLYKVNTVSTLCDVTYLCSLKGAAGSNGTNGTNGTSVTITSVDQKTGAGETSKITFSDGNSLSITNGSNGSNGSDGNDGDDGYNMLYSSYNGTSSTISLAKANISNNSSLKIGDLVLCKSGCLYKVNTVSTSCSVTYLCSLKGAAGSNGSNGTSVTITNIDQKTGAGETSTVTFSDGKTLSITNGSNGSNGTDGTDGTNGTNGSDGYNMLYSTANGTSTTTSIPKALITNNASLKIGDLVLCHTGCLYKVNTVSTLCDVTYLCSLKGAAGSSGATASVVSTTANGLAPRINDTSGFLRGDGVWTTNTTGASDLSNCDGPPSVTEDGKIYLVGAAYQTANETTFSNQYVYIDTVTNILHTQVVYQSSDERLKTFTEDYDINLDNIKNIKTGKFYWNSDNKQRINGGVSAQTVEEYFPELVSEDKNGIKSVNYDGLAVVAIAAIKKLTERIEQLEDIIRNK